ncbi:MAG TPA: hypothetical protein VMT18_08550, partial [Planctomycetota bacterium]|nr:hypothetical protein [Planctomycetota bacterium]
VARSRGGPLALVALLIVIGGGAAAAWYLLRGQAGEGGGGPAVRAVVPVEGDLLAEGHSFEGQRGGWESDPRASAGFALDSAARRSGEVGLLAELERAPDEPAPWALEQSPAVRVAAGRALSARAWLEAEGGAEVLLGVRLESSSDAAAQPVVFWDAPHASAGEAREFVVDVPPAYDRARALLLARLVEGAEAGEAGADDVSLVPVPAPPGRPKLGETELFASGSTAVLFKIDRALLSGLSFAPVGRAHDPAAPRARIEALSEEHGLRLSPAGAQGAQVLSFFVESGLAAGGLASTGTGGYRTHQVEFEREGAEALLVGRGRDRVRVACGGARVVRGQPAGGGFRVEVEFAAPPEVFVQTSFNAERDAAQTLARQARRAEAEGRLGEALSLWGRLLDEYPFEESLVRESETTRGRLEQAGHAELRELEVRLERARFFRLIDIFRRCREDAQALAARYEPSGVAEGARALIAQIDADSAGLAAELDAAERARLAAIEAALRGSGSTRLAERVAERLAELQSRGGH